MPGHQLLAPFKLVGGQKELAAPQEDDAQVNAAAWQTSGGGQNSGTILIGNLIKNYAFDGLGRLARTLSPYPNPAAAGGFNRTERFYYDGIRRIQEVITDPVSSSKQADESGDANLQQLAEETTPLGSDTQGTPLALELGQITSSGPAQVTQWLDREYVWGPGDGPGGIDELLVQYDNQRRPWWVIQDEGGDIAAHCDLGAANADGRVVGQYTYDAYGSPLSFDYLYTHPLMHCGHKGLFVDRLDVGVVLAGGVEPKRIEPGAALLCHNRNRTYSPKLGRFLQRDPNSTAEVLTQSLARHGTALSDGPDGCDLQLMYGDGASSYQYSGSHPNAHSDPLGLFDIDNPALPEFPDDVESLLDEGLNYIPNPGIEVYARVAVLAYRMARDLTTGYAAGLDFDAAWASDWHVGDDAYSRLDASWVDEIVKTQVQDFLDNSDPTSGLPVAVKSGKGGKGGRGRPHAKLQGKWYPRGHYASKDAIAYEERVCVKRYPNHEYHYNGTNFDTREGAIFVDAKGPGYNHLIDRCSPDGKFRFRNGPKGKIEAQMERQRKAAGKNSPIEWRVHEKEAKEAFEDLAGRHGITIRRVK